MKADAHQLWCLFCWSSAFKDPLVLSDPPQTYFQLNPVIFTLRDFARGFFSTLFYFEIHMYSIMAKMPTLGSLANQDYPNIQEAKIKMFGSSSFLLNHKFSRFGENHVIRTREYFSHRKKRRRRRNSDVTAFRKPYLQPLSSVAKDPSSGLPQLLGFLSVSAQVT